jgi:hypothetical protein
MAQDNESLGSIKCEEFLDQPIVTISFSKRSLLHIVIYLFSFKSFRGALRSYCNPNLPFNMNAIKIIGSKLQYTAENTFLKNVMNASVAKK